MQTKLEEPRSFPKLAERAIDAERPLFAPRPLKWVSGIAASGKSAAL
jgi:hypothetical protein